MKKKIEAARRARELASPRPHTKKRAASFAGGRSTPKTAAAGGGGAAGSGSAIGGAWGQAGGAQRGTGGRKAVGRNKARSSSEGVRYVTCVWL